MSWSKKKRNIRDYAVHVLQTALDLSRDVESLMRRVPGLATSRNPNILADYDNVISYILTQVQSVVREYSVSKKAVSKPTKLIIKLQKCMSAGSSTLRSGGPVLTANEATNRLENLENRTADHEVFLEENDQYIDDARQKINRLEQQLQSAQETLRRLEKKIMSQEQVLAKIPKYLRDFVRCQQVASYDGVLLWQIKHFSFKKQDAITGANRCFYSPCFYTSRHGYKMCARIFLNGDGMGIGTHISVFFVVMRGQFDEQLRWPFKQKVTIMLLDQDNVEHVIDVFRPDPNSSSPRRETTTIGGFPLFCSLAALNKHAYVRDDVMYIKIIVNDIDFM